MSIALTMFLRRHWRFLALLAVFIGAALAQQAVMPALEGPDEMLHQNYVDFIRAQNHLPDRANSGNNITRQASGQPPLTYWLAARLYDLISIPRFDGDVQFDLKDSRNPWSAPNYPVTVRDNPNLYFHGPGEQVFAYPGILAANRAARALSLLYGVAAVCGAYGAAYEVFACKGYRWALLATAIFALMPQTLHMSSILTNDISAVCFATLAIWQTLRLLRLGATIPRLLLIGVLVGLGGLSKVNALTVAPGIALALLFDWSNRRHSAGRLILNGLIVALPVAAIVGPWVLYGLVTYNDPFGFKTHTFLASQTLLPNEINPANALHALSDLGYTYLGTFGSTVFHMNWPIYDLLAGIVVLALLGYVLALVSRGARPDFRDDLHRQQTVVLLVVLMTTVAAFFYWVWTNFAIEGGITGRLIYPAHAAIAILVTGGLSRLRFDRLLRLYTIGVLVAGLVLAPVAIDAVFAPPPMLTPGQLPVLQGGPIDFDHTIRFLGYTQDEPALDTDQLHRMTLCWQVLQKASRPGAFSIKFFGQDGHFAGDRTSVQGDGLYSSAQWRPGDIFCDRVGVFLTGVQPGMAYNAVLVMLDVRTMAVDWTATTPDGQPIPVPVIGQFVGAGQTSP